MGRFDTTYDPNSPTEMRKRERSTLHIALFPDQMIGQQDTNPSCKDCKQKLIVVKGQYFCKGCGEYTPLNPPETEKDKGKKLVKKHGVSGGSMIKSQTTGRKAQKMDGSEIDDDMRRDLEGFGYSPED